jgi:hypothetical protein
MESFFALLQKNVLDRQRWATRADLRLAIISWIERTYYRRRRQKPHRQAHTHRVRDTSPDRIRGLTAVAFDERMSCPVNGSQSRRYGTAWRRRIRDTVRAATPVSGANKSWPRRCWRRRPRLVGFGHDVVVGDPACGPVRAGEYAGPMTPWPWEGTHDQKTQFDIRCARRGSRAGGGTVCDWRRGGRPPMETTRR